MNRIARLMNDKRPWMAGFGIETAMIFLEGLDLPHFAAFTLYDRAEGRAALARAAERSLTIAKEAGTGLVVDAETWRANRSWGAVMGLGRDEIAAINAQAVTYTRIWRDENETSCTPIAVNGVLGPLGDGYAPDVASDADQATSTYGTSARAIATAGADLATAITMTSSAEATGAARAMRDAGLAHAICFTVETDGRLPSGETLGEAIDIVDAVGTEPLFYGINCAHPTHFADALGIPQGRQIGMIRANASRLSHEELDAMDTLDAGDPDEWGRLCAGLVDTLPSLRLVGGCCGTDHRHLGCAAHFIHGQADKAA